MQHSKRTKRNLEHVWDRSRVLRNPHKGWYVHYFDNGLHKYGAALHPEDTLSDFPGLNHIYLRLAWSYLEPEEGMYNWAVIDGEIERWTKLGYTISFRVSCKETNAEQAFATPRWVMEAGAQGSMVSTIWSDEETWEPDYGDQIFLAKLEQFHRAFAARYDGAPWVEYIDIGSYGDWGEGHTAASSLKEWPLDVIKAHIDLHVRCYRQSRLVISDDIIGSREIEDGSKEEILHHLLKHGITLRDDGISVKWFADRFGASTMRSPELFSHFWPHHPIDLELEHYHMTVEADTWQGGVPFARAIEEAHATYIGFHGDPRVWLAENGEQARALANRVGYWFFVKSIEHPIVARACEQTHIDLVIENGGVAPAYQSYELKLKFECSGKEPFIWSASAADSRRWIPGMLIRDRIAVCLPERLGGSPCTLSVGLFWTEPATGSTRVVELGMDSQLRDEQGYYRLSELEVAKG